MNYQTLEQLIQTFKDDSELLQAIKDAFDSFEAYHAAIYSMETRKKILIHTADTQNYQEEITAMDRKRTACHNAVLANVSMLNRMADMAGLPPVYEGRIGGRWRTPCLNMCIRSCGNGPEFLLFS